MKRLLVKTIFSAALILMMAVSTQAADKLKMSVSAPGTSPYLTMTTMAPLVNQAQDKVEIKVDATGAATKHMIELAQGKLDICMSAPTAFDWMKRKVKMYKKMKDAPRLAKNLRLVYWFPVGQNHIVTYASSNIRSFEDVRGKKVFLGPPGGGAWATSRQWLERVSGLKVDEDYRNVKASKSSAFQGFQDRQFDVFITSGIAPFPQVEQLALTSKLYFLGLNKEQFEANEKAVAMTKALGRGLGIIPKGIYGKNVINTEDIYALQSVVGVVVNKSMSDDTAYLISKKFWEGVKKNVKDYPWLRFVTLEYAVQEGGMKLHPGVARYYREIGLNIPPGAAP